MVRWTFPPTIDYLALAPLFLFFKNHPYNMANKVYGKSINSYRAELQAVSIILQGTIKWLTKIWITLDNEAVVKDINAMITKGHKKTRQENKDIWIVIAGIIENRAANSTLRVAWTKGHAAQEHIDKGILTDEEKKRTE